MGDLKESDLYLPIYNHFTNLGYKVNSEVHDCDVTAVKEDQLIIVELKKHLNIKLLMQGAKRQRLTDFVYLAIPRPKNLRSKEWVDKKHLIRRLELGLIFVSFRGNKSNIDIVIHPEPFNRKQSKSVSSKKKKHILREIEGRYGDYNVGGTTKRKLMTAYRENALHIACCLKIHGVLSPKRLKELGTGDKTSSILQKNFYQWYDRVDRGAYALSSIGEKAIEEYKELADYYLMKSQNIS